MSCQIKLMNVVLMEGYSKWLGYVLRKQATPTTKIGREIKRRGNIEEGKFLNCISCINNCEDLLYI